jgi:hypothetical protein
MGILFIFMRLNEIVRYRDSNEYGHLTGVVIVVHGKKWLTVKWSDNVNVREHVDDLIFTGRLQEG